MKGFWTIILIGVGLRVLFNNLIDSPDAVSFVIWAKYLTEHNISDLYQNLPAGYLPYPPLYYFVLTPLGHLMKIFNIFDKTWLALLVVKFPVFLADILAAFLIYRFTRSYIAKKGALIASAFYFLNPAVIFNTSVWGQIDSVVTALSLASIYLIIAKKYFWGFFAFVAGSLIKLQTLAILPLAAFFALSMRSLTKLIGYGLILAMIAVLPFLSLILDKGLRWNLAYFSNLPNQYPYTSIYSYNIFAPVGFLVSDSNTFLGLISYKFLGLFLYFLIAIFVIVPLLKKKLDPKALMFAAFLLFFDFALFSTRIHSRYLIYTLGFFAPFFVKYPKLGLALTALVIANLLLPLHEKELTVIVEFLNKREIIWVFVTFGLVLFITMYRTYLRLLKSKSP